MVEAGVGKKGKGISEGYWGAFHLLLFRRSPFTFYFSLLAFCF